MNGNSGSDNARSTTDVNTRGDKGVSVLYTGVACVVRGEERVESGAHEGIFVEGSPRRSGEQIGVVVQSLAPVSILRESRAV